MPKSKTPKPPEPKRRVADMAYDRVEALIAKLVIPPGSLIVESELADLTQLGRTPVREALMRMVANGLIEQQPRRGLRVSNIDVLDHLDLIETRRGLETLIARYSARRASAAQRKDLVTCAKKMIVAGERNNLDDYMAADQELDNVNHAACCNASAVKAVVPLVIQCRRFWYRYQAAGEIAEGARAHMLLAQAIASGDQAQAAAAANTLMDYLEKFTRRVINT